MFPFTYQSTSCEHFDMLSSNLESTFLRSYQPRIPQSPRRAITRQYKAPSHSVPPFIGCHVFKEQLHRHACCFVSAFCEGFALCSLVKTRSSLFAKKLSFNSKTLFEIALLESDTGELALTDLCNDRRIFSESKRFIADFFAVQFDATLLDHPQRFGGTGGQAGLLQ